MSYQQYKKTSITTANRGQVLILLYEGAIQNIKKAVSFLEAKNIAKKGEHISKAHAIINELVNTLDHEVGGKIAGDLERLYNYMIEQLIKGNVGNDKAPLETVTKLLETLLEGWRAAVVEFNKNASKP